MSYLKGVINYNKGVGIYLHGDETTENSLRMIHTNNVTQVEKLVDDMWQLSSLQTDNTEKCINCSKWNDDIQHN